MMKLGALMNSHDESPTFAQKGFISSKRILSTHWTTDYRSSKISHSLPLDKSQS